MTRPLERRPEPAPKKALLGYQAHQDSDRAHQTCVDQRLGPVGLARVRCAGKKCEDSNRAKDDQRIGDCQNVALRLAYGKPDIRPREFLQIPERRRQQDQRQRTEGR